MRTKWIAFIIGCTLLGCANESVVNVSDDTSAPLVVNAPSFMDVGATAPTVTRAATTVTSGSLGVFLVANANYNTAINNVQYDYVTSGSSWVRNAASTPIYLTNNAASVYAYYPYSAANSNLTAIAMVSQKYTSAADLCYTKSASAPTMLTPSTSFVLDRAYSKVTIKLKKINAQSEGAITKISLHNDAIYKEAILNVITRQYTPSKPSTVDSPFSFDPGITSLPVYSASDPLTVIESSVLLVPVSALANSNKIELSMTLGGVDRSTTVTMPDAALAAGVNYDIVVSIDATAILSTTVVKSTDWITAVDNLPVIKPHK